MNVREEILQHLEDVAKYIEGSSFLTYACEIASQVREDYLLEALLKELKESASNLGRSKALRDKRKDDEALMFNHRACLHAYRAAMIYAYAKRDFHRIYLLATIRSWYYPENILEALF
jgi:hypothetical protein